MMLVAKSDNLWKHQRNKTAKSLGYVRAIEEKHMDYKSTQN